MNSDNLIRSTTGSRWRLTIGFCSARVSVGVYTRVDPSKLYEYSMKVVGCIFFRYTIVTAFHNKPSKTTCGITFDCRQDVDRRPSARCAPKAATRPGLLLYPLHTVLQRYIGVPNVIRQLTDQRKQHVIFLSRRHTLVPTTRFLCFVSYRR